MERRESPVRINHRNIIPFSTIWSLMFCGVSLLSRVRSQERDAFEIRLFFVRHSVIPLLPRAGAVSTVSGWRQCNS